MFKTPPLASEATFETPAKQIQVLNSPQSSASGVKIQQQTRDINQMNTSDLRMLTPKSPFDYTTPSTVHRSSIDQYAPSAGLSISTVFDTPTSATFPSPSTSPVNYNVLSSPIPIIPSSLTLLGNSEKLLPVSSIFSPSEVFASIVDSIIDPKFNDGLQLKSVIGKGSFSTVFNCTSNNHEFAIKIPKNTSSSKQVLKEMFNFKILSNYLQLHDLTNIEIPMLNVFGITYLDKSKYSKLRYGENLPCLVSSNLSGNLQELIMNENHDQPTDRPANRLHIGAELWWKLAKQLIMGLVVFKDCNMIHLDLKTSNILFDATSTNFKIADLTSGGLRDDITKQYSTLLENGSYFDVTLQYCSPELVQVPPAIPSFESDLYAVGLILLTAAIGEEPYTDFLSSQKSSNSLIILNECIKKNKILDLLSSQNLGILESNHDAFTLIKMILSQRAPLETIVSYLNDY